MELYAAGVAGFKSNSTAYYQVTDDWLKAADRIANPVTVEIDDPENTWEALEEGLPSTD